VESGVGLMPLLGSWILGLRTRVKQTSPLSSKDSIISVLSSAKHGTTWGLLTFLALLLKPVDCDAFPDLSAESAFEDLSYS